MPKHATNETNGTPSDSAQNEQDERIGLTEAFAPIEGDLPSEVAPEDEPIGLTEAFPPVAAAEGAHAGGFAYKGDSDDEYPKAIESLEPVAAPPLLFGDDTLPVEESETQGKHGKEKPPIPPHQRKSRRMRRILIVIIILIIVLMGASAFFMWQIINELSTASFQQVQEVLDNRETDTLAKEETKDATTATSKTTEVPNLASVLGLTQDQAVTALAHGATVTSSRDVNEEGNAIKRNVTVALTDEPADTRSGTPTVYLGLNEAGAVVQAGYSAATAALGYGSLSFSDAVKNEHIVEEALREAGIDVADGAAVLPADKMTYSTYSSDGTTLVRENCSFSGSVDLAGVPHEWSAVLLYDYSTANASGNLADTIRLIYVYINA